MFTLVIARILSSQQHCLANEIERLGMNSLSIFTLHWSFVKMYYSLPVDIKENTIVICIFIAMVIYLAIYLGLFLKKIRLL